MHEPDLSQKAEDVFLLWSKIFMSNVPEGSFQLCPVYIAMIWMLLGVMSVVSNFKAFYYRGRKVFITEGSILDPVKLQTESPKGLTEELIFNCFLI